MLFFESSECCCPRSLYVIPIISLYFCYLFYIFIIFLYLFTFEDVLSCFYISVWLFALWSVLWNKRLFFFRFYFPWLQLFFRILEPSVQDKHRHGTRENDWCYFRKEIFSHICCWGKNSVMSGELYLWFFQLLWRCLTQLWYRWFGAGLCGLDLSTKQR